MVLKRCSKCGVEKELNECNFNTRKDSKDGFRNECKTCKSIDRKKYYDSNKDVFSIKSKSYYEKNRQEILNKSREYRLENKDLISARLKKNKTQRNKMSRDYYYRHHEERKLKARLWKKNNPEKVKMNKKQWRKTERGKEYLRLINRKRKSRREGNTLTLKEWDECVKYFNNQCAYCGNSNGKLEMDHFVPFSKGGTLTKQNVVPACRNCNASKSNIDFLEWYKEQEFYSSERETRIFEYLSIKDAKEKTT